MKKIYGQQDDVVLEAVIAKVNDEAKKHVRSWLVIGEAVSAFVETRTDAGDDAFKILADHPECLLGASSLRSHHAAWQMWSELGQDGVPVEVTYTHFVTVATSAGLNKGTRKKLLEDAEANGWSVSELKRQIRLVRQGGLPSVPESDGNDNCDTKFVTIDWKTACKKLESRTASLVSELSALSRIENKGEISEDLRHNAESVIRLLIQHNLVSEEMLKGNDFNTLTEAA